MFIVTLTLKVICNTLVYIFSLSGWTCTGDDARASFGPSWNAITSRRVLINAEIKKQNWIMIDKDKKCLLTCEDTLNDNVL